jgi:hypothetical protein
VTSEINAGGLVLGIGGALALASAFMFKRPREVASETSSAWGWNPSLLESVAKQTADAWVGGTLLSLGFALQLADAVGFDPEWATLLVTLSAALATLVFAAVLLFDILRPWNVSRAWKMQLALELNAHRKPEYLHDWSKMIVYSVERAGRKVRPEDRPADLAIWALGQEQWDDLTVGLDLPDDLFEPYKPSG